MKRAIVVEDVEAAVIGGAILGGGGGGSVEAGLGTARAAVDAGTPALWSVDEFDPSDLAATVALVGAPSAPLMHLTSGHQIRALELLLQQLPADQRLVAVHTNENGAETTVNGWIHSALTELPVIDLACNGRAHPLGVMGSMGLHQLKDYVTFQGFAGGHPDRYLEGAVSGSVMGTASLVSRASQVAGGGVGVARNPVQIGYAIDNGAPGAISQAIQLGRCYLDGGVDAVIAELGGRVAAQGEVADYRCVQNDGLDLGSVRLSDAAGTTLQFVNEYLLLDQGDARLSAFPDLIMTFTEDGVPIPSAALELGQRIVVMTAPAASLTLSPTMFMPELYRPLETALECRFAPRAANVAADA